MKNPSWYEDPPEDPPEDSEIEPDYADILYTQVKEVDLLWDTPLNAPYNER